jgi:hypothetical protein
MRFATKFIAGVGLGAFAGIGLALAATENLPPKGLVVDVPPVDSSPITRVVPGSAAQVVLSYAPIVKSAMPAKS